MEQMYRMSFEEQEFNALMYYLSGFVDDSLIRKIRAYSTVIEKEGKQYISVRFFGDELQRLCWLLMVNLPESAPEDYFNPLVQEIKDREREYQERKIAEQKVLREGIKRELLVNPKVAGTEIARKLRVKPWQVYELWHEVRAEIEQEKKDSDDCPLL